MLQAQVCLLSFSRKAILIPFGLFENKNVSLFFSVPYGSELIQKYPNSCFFCDLEKKEQEKDHQLKADYLRKQRKRNGLGSRSRSACPLVQSGHRGIHREGYTCMGQKHIGHRTHRGGRFGSTNEGTGPASSTSTTTTEWGPGPQSKPALVSSATAVKKRKLK